MFHKFSCINVLMFADVIRTCQGRREIHAVKIIFDDMQRQVVVGPECMKMIGINDLLRVEDTVADIAKDYWCIPNTLSTLPRELLQNIAVNVIVNWQGLRNFGESNRVNWYANQITAPLTSEIFRALNKSLLSESFDILKDIPKPYLTVHLRIGRMLSKYHREAIELPGLYAKMGDSVIECILYRVESIINKHSIRSILVLDDFDMMEETIHPEMRFIKNRMQSELQTAFFNIKRKGIAVNYSLDLFATRAGCTHLSNRNSVNLWESLVTRQGNCSEAKMTVGRDYVLLDMTLAAQGDFILRVGMSLFSETICKLATKAYTDSCVSMLDTSEGFRHVSFQQAMKRDCPTQSFMKYQMLLNHSIDSIKIYH